jgi:hypothetical protein
VDALGWRFLKKTAMEQAEIAGFVLPQKERLRGRVSFNIQPARAMAHSVN